MLNQGAPILPERSLRVLRVYHAGGDEIGHGRLSELGRLGIDVIQAVPDRWGRETSGPLPPGQLRLPVHRPLDVNRHRYRTPDMLRGLVRELEPDLVDVHEEPFSVAGRQWLKAAGDVPVVMYTAQNLDKRFPPPFHQYEQAAFRQVAGFYPCSRQAASAIRGKGYAGPIRVLPLGYDDALFRAGEQSLDDDPLTLALVGRLVPEKGVRDAVAVLAAVRQDRKANLLVIGSGPEESAARRMAEELGVADAVELHPWASPETLAELYQKAHVLLIPSRSTATWVEQFGRVIVEAQASGAVVAGYASGSIPEVTAGAGVLAPEGDAAGLAQVVCGLLDDPVWFAALRRQGLQLAVGRTWRQVATAQLDLYRTAIRGTSEPARVGRDAAEAEFGRPATALGQDRPFALPLLRTPSAGTRALGRVFDALADGVAGRSPVSRTRRSRRG